MKSRPIRILVVDDDGSFLRLLTLRLESTGYEVWPADSAGAALDVLGEFLPDVIITDLRMDGMDGIDLLSELQNRTPGLPVILLTAHGTIPDAVRATQSGAYAFLTKPVDHRELREKIEKALSLSGPAVSPPDDWRRGIVTRSPAMEEILTSVQQVAPTDASVLIRGESGTGKEIIARALHDASGREGPFVAFNCAAIPMDLLESELFGYMKGAFTGANKDHAGLFRQAEGGTLFLDEIGEMPAMLQAKLLRVLEDRQVRPLGSTRTIGIRVRIVSATNKNLEERIAAGEFREDLFYRLNVISMKLPRLADRTKDIPLLVSHRLQQIARSNGSSPKTFSPDALAQLIGHDWPGNIRQLFNVVEQTAALSTGAVISERNVRNALGEGAPTLRSFDDARKEFTRSYLIQLLAATGGNVTQAARLAQRNRTDFYKLLNRHEIDPSSFKAN